MKKTINPKALLLSYVNKNYGPFVMIDYDKKFILDLEDSEARYLLEFVQKCYLGRGDKPGDLIPNFSSSNDVSSNHKEDTNYARGHRLRNDASNAYMLSLDELMRKFNGN